MTERKFTPPTEFPTDYIDGIGRKVTIYAMGHGQQPLLGQYHSGAMVSFDLNGYYGISDEDYYGISDEDYALHDIPKRITKWHNVYENVYDLVMAQHDKHLIKYMNERMKEGWQPVGGVVVVSSRLCQAVVRTPTLNEELKGQDDETS